MSKILQEKYGIGENKEEKVDREKEERSLQRKGVESKDGINGHWPGEQK